MRRGWAFGVAVAVLSAGGCSVATSTYHDASTAAGSIVGGIGTPVFAPEPAVVPAAAPPAMGAFLDGPVGARLGDADRQRAFAAEQDALAAGDRRTWRGVKGNYGFVSLAGAAAPDGCRDFTHTVYIAGRPVSGRGTGCKAPDGTWRITG